MILGKLFILCVHTTVQGILHISFFAFVRKYPGERNCKDRELPGYCHCGAGKAAGLVTE